LFSFIYFKCKSLPKKSEIALNDDLRTMILENLSIMVECGFVVRPRKQNGVFMEICKDDQPFSNKICERGVHKVAKIPFE